MADSNILLALTAKGFRLGGSRRMAEKFPNAVQVHDNTDWDYYGDNTDENRTTLAALGFEILDCPNRDYWDSLLADIYKHPSEPIEVLLRTDVERYTAAFESIDADTYVAELWKSSPLRNEAEGKSEFAARVCRYFNNLFYKDDLLESPF